MGAPARAPPPSGGDLQINTAYLQYMLNRFGPPPDLPDAHAFLKQLENGVRIGYSGPHHTLVGPNLPSAFEWQDKITADIDAEVRAGHIHGPFSRVEMESMFGEFRSSPLGGVPKKNSDKVRRIHHLSWPVGSSVNDHITLEGDLKYDGVRKFFATLQRLGPGAQLWAADIQSAYRHIRVHPADRHLLVFQWPAGAFYYEERLPFGLSSSPFLWDCLARLLTWFSSCLGADRIERWVDDFAGASAPGTGDAQRSMDVFLQVCQQAHVRVSMPKLQPPTHTLEWVGLIWDTTNMVQKLPEGKLAELQALLQHWRQRKKATLKELESLLGKLRYCAQVIPPGRAFTQRVATMVAALQRQRLNGLRSYHHVYLPSDVRADLDEWAGFFSTFNGRRIIPPPITHTATTDASGSIGMGGFWQDQWFFQKWTPAILLLHSTHGREVGSTIIELLAIATAVAIWAVAWANTTVLIRSDNQGAVEAMTRGHSSSGTTAKLIRFITRLAMDHSIEVRVQYIPGVDNVIADAISRAKWTQFRQLLPTARADPTPIPGWMDLKLRATYA